MTGQQPVSSKNQTNHRASEATQPDSQVLRTDGASPLYRLHLFTLRVWLEPLDQAASEWRGEVKNTSTGEVRYFRNTRTLYDSLLVLLDTSPDERHDEDRSVSAGKPKT